MDLSSLKAMGAISSRSLVKKDVLVKYPVPLPQEQWTDPEVAEYPDEVKYQEDTIEIHVRKRSSADFIELTQAEDRLKPFVIIFRCACKPDGTQIFDTLDQVLSLKEWFWLPLMTVVNEVNEFGLKNSQPRTSSGAKSRSSSAAARSRNGKKRSLKKSAPSGLRTGPSAAL